MSIIAICGAVVLQLSDLDPSAPFAWGPVGAGVVVAFLSGLAALALFVRLLRTRAFHRFAFYVWAVGALAIALALTR